VSSLPGQEAAVRHIPRPAFHTMAITAAMVKPALGRRARAALALDTIDMTFDPSPTRRSFPDLPNTDMPTALEELLA